MTQEALSILRAAMADMRLPYALGQYRAVPLPETYFVGQWVDAESFTEDGRADSTMTGVWLDVHHGSRVRACNFFRGCVVFAGH